MYLFRGSVYFYNKHPLTITSKGAWSLILTPEKELSLCYSGYFFYPNNRQQRPYWKFGRIDFTPERLPPKNCSRHGVAIPSHQMHPHWLRVHIYLGQHSIMFQFWMCADWYTRTKPRITRDKMIMFLLDLFLVLYTIDHIFTE